MKQKLQHIAIAKCLIWGAILLSPLQALHGMHVLCAHCTTCSCESDADSSSNEYLLCGCRKSVHSDAEQEASARALPDSPCPCGPDCWCHRPTQPQMPSQESSQETNLHEVALSFSFSDLHVVRKPRFTPVHRCDFGSLSAQETCVSLCRFQA